MEGTKSIRRVSFSGVDRISMAQAVDEICIALRGVAAISVYDRLAQGLAVVFADGSGQLRIYQPCDT